MEGRSLFEVAKEYLEKGYSIIPIEEGGKRPIIKWQEFQKRKASVDEAALWFSGSEASRRNIAICTGSASGVNVVDVDPRHGGAESATALGMRGHTVRTGGGGWHWYYRADVSSLPNSAGRLPGVDIRGDGGYVLAPPSRTKEVYRFEDAVIPRNTDLQPMPSEIRQRLSLDVAINGNQNTRQLTRPSPGTGSLCRPPLTFTSVREGGRNNAAAETAGRIISYYHPTYDNGFRFLVLWNIAYVVPPLDESELRATYDSIWRKHYRESGNI